MDQCEFCERLEWMKKHDRRSKKELKEIHGRNYYPHYKAKLYTYYTSENRTTGSLTSRPYKLNYCPVCGKKLKGCN